MSCSEGTPLCPFERVEKVDTLQVEICLRQLSLDIKGLRSHER